MLKQKLQSDLIQALKAKNEVTVSTLRMLNAALKNAEIAAERKALTDEQVLQLVKREIKQRQDANTDFERGGRQDLVTQNQKEIDVLKKYLPEQLSEEALREMVQKVIDEIKPSSPADFGKVMKAVMVQVQGRADGTMISRVVKEKLAP